MRWWPPVYLEFTELSLRWFWEVISWAQLLNSNTVLRPEIKWDKGSE